MGLYEVLLVDDKEIVCRSLARMPFFQRSSEFMVVHSARNGREALDYLRSHPVDVVLTDIRMPLMDGIELLKVIQLERLCRCTVLVSAFAEFSYAREGFLHGAFDYLVKPVDDETLQAAFARIREHLQRGSAARPGGLEDLPRLVDLVLNGTAEELSGALAETVERLGDAAEDGAVLEAVIEGVLDGIHAQVPYATLYVPLRRICGLGGSAGEGPAQRACARLMLLQRELEKLRSNARHPLVQKAWHYTLQHIEGCCKLQEIAEAVYVNKNYLSTLFKRETGINYKEFVVRFKIERAKMLLTDPDVKIYNIAEDLQFSDPEYFGRVFKAQVGVPPGRFDYGAYLGIDEGGPARSRP